jgi:hypothetical protein
MHHPRLSPASETPQEVAEMLELATQWLGQPLQLDSSGVSVVEHRGTIQTSRYAEVFAKEYGNLVGMPEAQDLLALYREGKDKRGTGPFTLAQMQRFDCKSVLDTCSGCRYDHLFLAGAHQRGAIDLSGGMTMNEVDVELGKQGKLNVDLVEATEGTMPVDAEETSIYWQHLARELGERAFDCVTCLGNSYSHLGEQNQRLASAANFALTTTPGGVCIVDNRNFDKMMAHEEEHREQALAMLSGDAAQAANNRALFPGSIANSPVYIGPDRVIIGYVRRGTNKPHALVQFFPLTRAELVANLAQFFGGVEIFHDRKGGGVSEGTLGSMDGPATIQCVCTEPKYDAARAYLTQRGETPHPEPDAAPMRNLLSAK